MSKELDLPVIPCNCEGFRGVSQSLGHHISNDTIRDYVIETREFTEPAGPYDIALIGDYNIGGDVWSVKPLLEECGFNVKASWTGDGQIEQIAATHQVKLNVIHCYRSMNYMARVMEEKYKIPWIELNFFGPTKIKASLRKLAERFDDNIKEKVEAAIAKYDPEMQKVIAKSTGRDLKGKKVMLYVGGLRPRHTVSAYEDLGMQVVGSGYEFAHNDDYERTAPEMPEATVIYDDVSEYELEQFVHTLKPDLVGSGIKEKYLLQKMGIHSARCTAGTIRDPTMRTRAFRSLPATSIWLSTAPPGNWSRRLSNGVHHVQRSRIARQARHRDISRR
jgi:nitrogenase molybdenum-iron protein alpha chain